jgi:endonuclease/exonuclease/phosphatase family metal-dependent hydrolase
MRGWFALIAMAAGASGGAGPELKVMSGNVMAPHTIGRELRILDWNIDKGKRLDNIVQTIREHEPDLVLIQEVDYGAKRTGQKNVTEELAKAVKMNWTYGPSYLEIAQGTTDQPAYLGQGILTTLPLREARLVRFQRQTKYWKPQRYLPNKMALLQRREGGRTALVAEFGEGRTQLVVYNLHLESRGFGATSLGQLTETLADAERYGPEVTVIVAGDLNSKYRKGLYAEKLGNKKFHNCFSPKTRTHRLWGTLDWIAVRGPGTCQSSAVIRGAKGSDHDALEAVIAFGTSK